MANIEQWLKRAKQAFNNSERQHAKNTWLSLARYVLNNQTTEFYDDATPGIEHSGDLTSTVAVRSNKELASIIHSTVTSPAIKWSKFMFSEEADNQDPQKARALEAISRRWYDELNESNFALEVSRIYPQFCAMGNAALFIGDAKQGGVGFQGFKFRALHIGQLAWSEGHQDVIDTVFRKFKLTAEQLVNEFPAKVPDFIVDTVEQQPDRQYVVYEIFSPREKSKIKLNEFGLAKPEHRPYQSLLILENDATLLKEDGYYDLPIAILRWETGPGEVYGRSRAHEALPQIKVLNKLEENAARASDLAINPTFITERSNVIGQFKIVPGGLIQARDMDKVKPLVDGTNFRVKEYDIPVLKEEIKQVFFLDKLLLPPRTETGEQTTYEIAQRIEQAQRVLGPVIGRINEELLKKVAEYSFQKLLRRLAEEDGPNEGKQLQALFPGSEYYDIKVEFVNPLARSQKISEVSNMQSWLQDILVMAQSKPDILDNINFDEVVKRSAQILGISADLLRPDQDVQKDREARAQVQAELQQKQNRNLDADSASKESR